MDAKSPQIGTSGEAGQALSKSLSQEEKRLLWKCDRHILPILFSLLGLSFIGKQ